MKDQIVSYKTAKLAKNKEFNENCFYHYDVNGILQENSDILNIGCEGGLTTEQHLIDNHSYPEITIAPTQYLLQRWLREKHKIRVIVTSWMSGYWGYKVYVMDETPAKGWKERNETLFGNTHSYEEALETGLIYALNLIT